MDQTALAKKKVNLMIAVVVLLMLVSFIALQLNNTDKLAVNNSAPASEAVGGQVDEGENTGLGLDKKINISDVVSAEKLAEVSAIKAIADEDHVIGSEAEPVKLVIYSDFECTYCAQFAETVNQARQEFAGKLAVVFRHYPLVEAHPNSLLAAEASECASEQGKFWEMHDALFQAQRTNSLNAEAIKQMAVDLNLDKTRFNECLTSEKYADKILAQIQEAKSATVSGSPTAFINGELITGANPYEDGLRSDGSKLEGLKSKILRKLEGK